MPVFKKMPPQVHFELEQGADQAVSTPKSVYLAVMPKKCSFDGKANDGVASQGVTPLH